MVENLTPTPIPLTESEKAIVGQGNNIKGLKFNRLTALSPSHLTPQRGLIHWHFICDCGSRVTISGYSARTGHTKSCGCLQRENAPKNAIRKHNKSKTPEYHTWMGMKVRCYQKTSDSYQHYGGRGIKVCERWRNSFPNFFADMGEKPFPNASIERKDVNGDYCPENCVWMGIREQQRNKTNTRRITFNGQSLTVMEWAEKLGLNRYTIRTRLQKKFPVELILQVGRLEPRNRHSASEWRAI